MNDLKRFLGCMMCVVCVNAHADLIVRYGEDDAGNSNDLIAQGDSIQIPLDANETEQIFSISGLNANTHYRIYIEGFHVNVKANIEYESEQIPFKEDFCEYQMGIKQNYTWELNTTKLERPEHLEITFRLENAEIRSNGLASYIILQYTHEYLGEDASSIDAQIAVFHPAQKVASEHSQVEAEVEATAQKTIIDTHPGYGTLSEEAILEHEKAVLRMAHHKVCQRILNCQRKEINRDIFWMAKKVREIEEFMGRSSLKQIRREREKYERKLSAYDTGY